MHHDSELNTRVAAGNRIKMAAPADLPNIPGFRPNRIARDTKKKTGFKMVHGVAMEPPQPLDPDTVAAATARAVDRARSTASFNASISQSFAPSASVTATAQWLDCAGKAGQAQGGVRAQRVAVTARTSRPRKLAPAAAGHHC